MTAVEDGNRNGILWVAEALRHDALGTGESLTAALLCFARLFGMPSRRNSCDDAAKRAEMA